MPAKSDGDPSPDVDDIPDWAKELKPCDNFGPAASSVDNVFGCAKPDSLRIDEWIEFVREKGVSRIVVLTEIDSSGYDGYYEKFLEEFGEENVCQAPVADLQLCETELLNEKIIPFINTSIENEYLS